MAVPNTCTRTDCQAAPVDNRGVCSVHMAGRRAFDLKDVPVDWLAKSVNLDGVAASNAELASWFSFVGELLDQNHGAWGDDITAVSFRRLTVTDRHLDLVVPAPVTLTLSSVSADTINVAGSRLFVHDVTLDHLVLNADEVSVRDCTSRLIHLNSTEHCSGVQMASADGFSVYWMAGDTCSLALYDGGCAGLRLRGGTYDLLALRGIAGLESLDLANCTVAQRLQVSELSVTNLRLFGCTVGDLTISDTTAEHAQLVGCRVADVHVSAMRGTSLVVAKTTVASNVSVDGEVGLVHLGVGTMVEGSVVVSGPPRVSLGGARVTGTFHVEGGSRAVVAASVTEGKVKVGSPAGLYSLQADDWHAFSTVTAYLDAAAENTINEAKWDESSTVWLTPSRDQEKLSFSSFAGGHLRVEGVSFRKADQIRPAVRFIEPLSVDSLTLVGCDLSGQYFAGLPLSAINLGAGNVFGKRRGRSVVADAEPGYELQSSKEVAHVYSSLRAGIEKGADTTLANDFYIGEMKARTWHEPLTQ